MQSGADSGEVCNQSKWGLEKKCTQSLSGDLDKDLNIQSEFPQINHQLSPSLWLHWKETSAAGTRMNSHHVTVTPAGSRHPALTYIQIEPQEQAGGKWEAGQLVVNRSRRTDRCHRFREKKHLHSVRKRAATQTVPCPPATSQTAHPGPERSLLAGRSLPLQTAKTSPDSTG